MTTVAAVRKLGRQRATAPGIRGKPLEEDRLAYRPAELASLVGLSTKAVYRAIARGELGAAKIANGSRLLIPAEAAVAWLATTTDRAQTTDGGAARRRRQSHDRPLSDALIELHGALSDGRAPTQERGEWSGRGLLTGEDDER